MIRLKLLYIQIIHSPYYYYFSDWEIDINIIFIIMDQTIFLVKQQGDEAVANPKSDFDAHHYR